VGFLNIKFNQICYNNGYRKKLTNVFKKIFYMSENIVQWNLSDFFDSINDPRIDKTISEIEEKVEDFVKKAKGNLQKIEPAKLKELFKEYEEINEKSFYLSVYSYLVYSTNSIDEEVKSFYAKIDEFTSKVSEKMLFFEIELNTISDEDFKKLVEAPELKEYKHYLEFNRLQKPHQLSEKEEQIIIMKDLVGSKAFNKLYTEIVSRFSFQFELDGEIKTLTGPQLISLLQHKDREVRKRALLTYVEAYKNNELVLTHIYNNVIKDFDLETKKRNYEKPVQLRNLENEVEDEIVEALEKATTESYKPLVERYYNLKKNILGYDDLHMYDIYAPVGNINKEYEYEEAVEIIKQATENFDPEFKEIVENMVKKGHIDLTPRRGKEGGAYCHYGKLKNYPFVFVNYTKTIDSVLTLAHELGHAIHFYYTLKNQNYVNIFPTIPMAEIASVFCEIMTFDYLINQELKKEEKIALLCTHLEGNFATSHRQNAFYRFEKQIHELMSKKLPSTKDYVDIFTNEMQLMFGNAVEKIKEEYSHYAFVVNHFLHTPFYVYAYNMSNLMVIALYQLYLEKGKEYFIPRYKKLLSSGGSATPQEMLKEFEIDLKDAEFWKKGLKYLESKIDELEKLIQ